MVSQVNPTLNKIKDNIEAMLGALNEFVVTDETQTVQAVQIAAESQKFSELLSKLLHLSESISQ